jgi:hypothetical protein
MPSIAQIQHKMKMFDTQARQAVTKSHPEEALQKTWKAAFDTPISNASAKSFVNYYREMRSKTRSLRGGMAMSPAPLSYTTTPGVIGVYGNFPTEIATDPASIQNLDVFYQSALTRGCGTENSSLHVPEEMGSNKIGGRRTRTNRKTSRKYARSYKAKRAQTKSRKNGRKTGRKTLRKRAARKFYGGNLYESLMTHPYISSAPPNMIQQLSASMSGSTSPVPFPGNPSTHQWQYVSNGTGGLINPGAVTPIGSDFAKLASPAPWQTSN